MASQLSSTVRALISTLRSNSAHRGAQAAQLASDLYSLSVESVSDTELGKFLAAAEKNFYNSLLHPPPFLLFSLLLLCALQQVKWDTVLPQRICYARRSMFTVQKKFRPSVASHARIWLARLRHG